jgi:hypothetical protein
MPPKILTHIKRKERNISSLRVGMSPLAFVGGMRGGSRSWNCGVVVIVIREERHRIGGMSPVAFVGGVKGVKGVKGVRGVERGN